MVVAFAGGFATGNAVGIALEQRLAIGTCVVRMISAGDGRSIAEAIRQLATKVTGFAGMNGSQTRSLVYALCSRRCLPDLLEAARAADPNVFYAVERFAGTGFLTPSVQPTGWRATFKKK